MGKMNFVKAWVCLLAGFGLSFVIFRQPLVALIFGLVLSFVLAGSVWIRRILFLAILVGTGVEIVQGYKERALDQTHQAQWSLAIVSQRPISAPTPMPWHNESFEEIVAPEIKRIEETFAQKEAESDKRIKEISKQIMDMAQDTR